MNIITDDRIDRASFVTDILVLTFFTLSYGGLIVSSLTMDARSTISFFTTWALLAHFFLTINLLLFRTILLACTKDIQSVKDIYFRLCHSFIPSDLILSITVFVSIMLLLSIYPNSILEESDIDAEYVAKAEMYNVATHVFPIFASLWMCFTLYPETHKTYFSGVLLEKHLRGLSCVHRTYVHFLHVYCFVLIYALTYESDRIYGTPMMTTTIIVFGVGMFSALCVGYTVIGYTTDKIRMENA